MKLKARIYIFLRDLRTYGLVHRCFDCGRPDHILGVRVGDHWDCIPF